MKNVPLYGASVTNLQSSPGFEWWGATGPSWTLPIGNLTKDQTVGYVLAGEALFSLAFTALVSINLSRTGFLNVPFSVAGGLAFTAFNLVSAWDWAASTFGA